MIPPPQTGNIFTPPHDPAFVWAALRACIIATLLLSVAQVGLDSYNIVAAPGEGDSNLVTTIWYYGYTFVPYAAWLAWGLTLILLLWLVHRLMRNLHTLSSGATLMSPTLAIGTLIAPFINIVMTPRVVSMIAKYTLAEELEKARHGAAIGRWWFTYLLAALLSYIAAKTAGDSGAYSDTAIFQPELYEMSLYFNVGASALLILACVFMIQVFQPLARAQSAVLRTRRTDR